MVCSDCLIMQIECVLMRDDTDRETLRQLNITHIINISRDKSAPFSQDVTYHQCYIADNVRKIFFGRAAMLCCIEYIFSFCRLQVTFLFSLTQLQSLFKQHLKADLKKQFW